MFQMNDTEEEHIRIIKQFLPKNRSIVFVGMMGAGKSTVGRKVAFKLEKDFVDTDVEIENAAQLTISEIFSLYGEEHFRDIERKIIHRLLGERRGVISVGGGAFMDENLRQAITQNGVSIWLKADFDVLMSRVHRHSHRPLLDTADPEIVMKRLIDQRYPIYAQSDITISNTYSTADMTAEQTFYELAHFVKIKFPQQKEYSCDMS